MFGPNWRQAFLEQPSSSIQIVPPSAGFVTIVRLGQCENSSIAGRGKAFRAVLSN